MNGTEDEGHSSAIKTSKQLIAVVLAAFLFPVVTIWLLAKLASSDISADPNDPAFSDEAVARRLKPVGELVLTSDIPPQPDLQTEEGPGQTASAVAAPMADAGDPENIKAIYAASCAACHTTGAAGAPKLGDSSAWAPRIKAGSETLYTSAIKGKNAMPPKGGNPSLSDAEVKAVVDYMVSQSK